jgi:hypothetical protein
MRPRRTASRISAPLKVRQRRAARPNIEIGAGSLCIVTALDSAAFAVGRVAADQGCGRNTQHSARKSRSSVRPPDPAEAGDWNLHCMGQKQICIYFVQQMISF